ncbi:MAG TPA: hypothetical protein VK853_07700 [Ilumatobacteraceae bacterium]|nr:hypothetical protein [Ilumatobacteraceae bacterium]
MNGVAMVGISVLAPAITTGWLLTCAALVAASAMMFARAARRLAPPRPLAADEVSRLRDDSPAVVNMVTNDATVTAAGLRATMIDLAARGWLRILPPDEDDELARVRPAARAHQGDALRPHERLVLQHVIARFTSDRAIPARYLAVDIRGTWWRRFTTLVAAEARSTGLVTRRWRPVDLGVPGGLTVIAGLCWFAGLRAGADAAVIDSVERRVAAMMLLVAIGVLVVRLISVLVRPSFTLTNEGVGVTAGWLAVRRRLDQAGFAELAPSAIELGDRRLAYATAMCVAEGAAIELPLAREDHYRAWSTVGGRARLVRVRYPWRIGFGLSSLTAMIGGLVSFALGMRLHSWAEDVARGEAFPWIYEQIPEQDWLVADVATGIAIVALLPVAAGLWLMVAGAIDVFASSQRTGVVVRARRPVEVSPLPRRVRRLLDRDRYRVFVAVDDGTTDTVTAWQATERTAVPQGVRATVKASAVLGRVRSATPVGHRLVD